MIQEQFYKIARIEYFKFLRILIKNVRYLIKTNQINTNCAKQYIRENNIHIKTKKDIFLKHTINN